MTGVPPSFLGLDQVNVMLFSVWFKQVGVPVAPGGLNGHLAVTDSTVTNGSDCPCKFSAATLNSYCFPSSNPFTIYII